MWSKSVREQIKDEVWLTRAVERSRREQGCDTIRDASLIRLKRKTRATIARANVPLESVIYYSEDGQRTREFFTVTYNDGGKDELRETLWGRFARRNYSPYDCTGQWFTSHILVGHICDNRYRVCMVEYLDV